MFWTKEAYFYQQAGTTPILSLETAILSEIEGSKEGWLFKLRQKEYLLSLSTQILHKIQQGRERAFSLIKKALS